ncbi:MAG: hypothetical protein QG594_1691, partial [Bacteroidota bacterium]|nr:hypothetical protein [Bacteroidota bacterium]
AFGFVCWRLWQSERTKKELLEKYSVLEMKVDGLKLDTLESRLNPHLFKNILNSVQSHANPFDYKTLKTVCQFMIFVVRLSEVEPPQY